MRHVSHPVYSWSSLKQI